MDKSESELECIMRKLPNTDTRLKKKNIYIYIYTVHVYLLWLLIKERKIYNMAVLRVRTEDFNAP